MAETKNDFFRLPGLLWLIIIPFLIILLTVRFSFVLRSCYTQDRPSRKRVLAIRRTAYRLFTKNSGTHED